MSEDSSEATRKRPEIVGDVVFGGADSPVAVCTLGSRTLLPELSGRPEIAVAGRVFTENVGVEKMVQNLAGLPAIRFLLLCGRETRHRVGQTIVALHRNGLDAGRRVVGSEAPEPVLPNLSDTHLAHFRKRITLIDRIGDSDASDIVDEARRLAEMPSPDVSNHDVVPSRATSGGSQPSHVEQVVARRDPVSAWTQDPVGYFVVLVDRDRRRLLAEQYSAEHRLLRTLEGRAAEEICHTIVRLGQVTLPAHAAYLGRELAKAETALALGLDYEQDRPLGPRPPGDAESIKDTEEAHEWRQC